MIVKYIYDVVYDTLELLEEGGHTLPHLLMPAFNTLNELLATKTSDYKLINYSPMDTITAPMAV